ncbi:unnamed protein product [Linum trigynum]|uniref:Uncharacterized protein n=1 Tax=Linum trigynum TaxID=586398 RepID=A0AAV2DT76_9ROSI
MRHFSSLLCLSTNPKSESASQQARPGKATTRHGERFRQLRRFIFGRPVRICTMAIPFSDRLVTLCTAANGEDGVEAMGRSPRRRC